MLVSSFQRLAAHPAHPTLLPVLRLTRAGLLLVLVPGVVNVCVCVCVCVRARARGTSVQIMHSVFVSAGGETRNKLRSRTRVLIERIVQKFGCVTRGGGDSGCVTMKLLHLTLIVIGKIMKRLCVCVARCISAVELTVRTALQPLSLPTTSLSCATSGSRSAGLTVARTTAPSARPTRTLSSCLGVTTRRCVRA